MSIFEYVLCAFAFLILASILGGFLAGKIMRWCARHDDQLSAEWKPPEEE